MKIAGLLLAAGAGTRFGGPKALAPWQGRFLVERGVSLLGEGGCVPVHVVLGAERERVAATADLSQAVAVENPDWATGMGSSLRAGLASLPDSAEAVVIALVDQPLIGAEAVRRLRRAAARGAVAAVATYQGELRNPVLLARSVWPEAAASAEADRGARAYLRAHPARVTLVPCDDTGSPADVDTPEDLNRLLDDERSGDGAARSPGI